MDPQYLRRRSEEKKLVTFRLRALWAALGVLVLAHSGAIQAQAGAEQSRPHAVSFLYVSRDSPPDARGSLTEPVVADFGWQGAQFGVKELNANGQFLGAHFEIRKLAVAADADLAAALRGALESHADLVVADLTAADLLKAADLPESRGAVIIDARTSDDPLRHAQCRGNVFHVLPSWQMRAAALSHFLVGKGWRRWLLLDGLTDDDVGYGHALHMSAAASGATILRETALPALGPDNSWTQAQVDARIEAMTRSSSPYDLILVTDREGSFGERIMFNSAESRLVAGTQGLRAVAWDAQFRDFAARGFGYRFAQFASRPMSERDYGNWLAVTILGEAALRGQVTDAAKVKEYLRSNRFSVAAFKGEPLTFQLSNQQLRQPLLLFGPKVLVAMSPPDAAALPADHKAAGKAQSAAAATADCQLSASP
jgi:ABC transporter substrate binding protein (PQQ-dependent alcohol dehydrogenase system)